MGSVLFIGNEDLKKQLHLSVFIKDLMKSGVMEQAKGEWAVCSKLGKLAGPIPEDSSGPASIFRAEEAAFL